jgi:hypothetical protein
MKCSFKMPLEELQRDPNTQVLCCDACIDPKDPWALPMRAPDPIIPSLPLSPEQRLEDVDPFVSGRSNP